MYISARTAEEAQEIYIEMLEELIEKHKTTIRTLRNKTKKLQDNADYHKQENKKLRKQLKEQSIGI